MKFEFDGRIIFWRGPAPRYFMAIPAKQSRELQAISKLVTYGSGVIPVIVRIGKAEFKTSLFHKDGRNLAPIRAEVRKRLDLDKGDTVSVQLEITRSPFQKIA